MTPGPVTREKYRSMSTVISLERELGGNFMPLVSVVCLDKVFPSSYNYIIRLYYVIFLCYNNIAFSLDIGSTRPYVGKLVVAY